MTTRRLLGVATALLFSAAQAETIVLTNDFGTGYTDGNLIGPVSSPANTVGQNGWTQTGTFTAGNPITIASGKAVLAAGSSGQDGYKGFASAVDSTLAGNYLLTRIDFSVTSATLNGDYFFHLSSPTGTTSNFYQRFFARSQGSGFALGINPVSTASTTYGTTELPLNTPLTAVIKWDFVAGLANDPQTVYVNPTDPIITNNTPYVTMATWSAPEPTTPLSAVNLRIGGSTTAPGITVSNIQISSVPEPSAVALAGLGLAAAGVSLRRGFGLKRRPAAAR